MAIFIQLFDFLNIFFCFVLVNVVKVKYASFILSSDKIVKLSLPLAIESD